MRKTNVVAAWVLAGLAVGAGCMTCEARAAGQPVDRQEIKPGGATSGVDLRPRFVAGRVTRYVMEMNSSNALKSASTPELNQDQSQEERIELMLKVKSADAEGAEVELTYQRVVAKLKTPDGEFVADSAGQAGKAGTRPGEQWGNQPSQKPTQKPTQTPSQKPSGRPGLKSPSARASGAPGAAPGSTLSPSIDDFATLDMDDVLKQYVDGAAGTVLTIKVDGAGNLVSVSGGEKLAGGIGGGMGGGMMGANPGAMANWVVGGVGAPGNVQVGQKWTTSTNLQGTPLGAFGMNTSYTLRSAVGGQARLEFRGNAEGQSAAAALMPGFQLKGASYSGEATWDSREGEIAGMTANTDVALGGNVGGVTAEMTAKQRVKVTRTR